MKLEIGTDEIALGDPATIGVDREAPEGGRHAVEAVARVEDGETARDGPHLFGQISQASKNSYLGLLNDGRN